MNGDLERIMREYPQLDVDGYGIPSRQRLNVPPAGEAEFERTRLWIRGNFEKAGAINVKMSSLGLNVAMDEDTGTYSSHGIFIAAMLAEGFVFKSKNYPLLHGGSGYFNITDESLRRVCARTGIKPRG